MKLLIDLLLLTSLLNVRDDLLATCPLPYFLWRDFLIYFFYTILTSSY